MLRVIPGLILAVALVVGTAVGAAATLGVEGQTVQAGMDDDLQCDKDGITLSYTVVWDTEDQRFEITSVHLGGVTQPDCGYKQLKLKLLWVAPYSDTYLLTQTNSSTDFNLTLTAPRPAEALIGWAIAIHDGPI